MVDDLSTATFAPEPLLVTGTVVSATVQEISLLIGQNRTLIGDNGLPTGKQKVTWIGAYAMAPATAIALRDSLNAAIEQYEKAFGKIPTDPSAKLRVTTPESAA